MNDVRMDWDEVHRRIDAANAAIASRWSPGPEETTRILRQRGRLLARETEKRVEAETLEVVEFMLAKEHYGIESCAIREVYPLKDYTPLPCVPAFVLGLLNVRGRIISVIDLKKFFDMPEKGLSDLNKVIIIHDDKMEFGILADAILGVRNIAVSALGPALPTLTGIRAEFLKGVTGERLVILDAAGILTDKNIVVHEEV
jgi:purine-binding chemotaxis protein CheW